MNGPNKYNNQWNIISTHNIALTLWSIFTTEVFDPYFFNSKYSYLN